VRPRPARCKREPAVGLENGETADGADRTERTELRQTVVPKPEML
jgi:hypothetical protein